MIDRLFFSFFIIDEGFQRGLRAKRFSMVIDWNSPFSSAEEECLFSVVFFCFFIEFIEVDLIEQIFYSHSFEIVILFLSSPRVRVS